MPLLPLWQRLIALSLASPALYACTESEPPPEAPGAALELPPPPDLGDGITSRVIALENARGEAVRAVVAEPAAAGPHPAVLLLHGSGGLYRMPQADDAGTCSPDLEEQFEYWAGRLVESGFLVLMPDSFGSRGFCDDNDDPRREQAFPPVTEDEDGKTRRLLARLYDAETAMASLASMASVRAGSIALLGFSNGASTAALYLHHRLSDALQEFAESETAATLAVDLPPLPESTASPSLAVAYYPGCGFDGVLPFSTDPIDVERFFYPQAPLHILHAELDPLLAHCVATPEDEAAGVRELQADAYAAQMALPDHYTTVTYPGADHGFDDADCESADAPAGPDTEACRAARLLTLELLDTLR